MAYTSTVEFVWLPAATSPSPADPLKIQILPKRPTPPSLHRASSRDAASRREPLTAQPAAPALRGNVWWKGGLRRCARNDGGAAPPGFLRRILGSRREARTKSELLLACLRRSWHIRLQWNSCGCRRRLRPARQRPLKIQFLPERPTPSPLFSAPATRRRRSPFSCRACSCPQRSEADAGAIQLLPSLRARRSHPRSCRRSLADFPAPRPRCRDPQKQLTMQPVA